MPRYITKFRRPETDVIFHDIVSDDRLYDEVLEDLNTKKSLSDIVFSLKKTIEMRSLSNVNFEKVEWEKLAKSLTPIV